MTDVTQTYSVEPIVIGADAAVMIQYPSGFQAAFDLMAGSLSAHFRARVTDDGILFSASTGDGTITRAVQGDGSVIVTINIAKAYTLAFPSNYVGFDIRRTIGAAEVIVPGQWQWPTLYPYTRS